MKILDEHELIGFTKQQIVDAYLKLVEAHGQEVAMRQDEASKAIDLRNNRDDLREEAVVRQKEFNRLVDQIENLKRDYNAKASNLNMLRKDLNDKDALIVDMDKEYGKVKKERDVLHEQLEWEEAHSHYHYHLQATQKLTQVGGNVLISSEHIPTRTEPLITLNEKCIHGVLLNDKCNECPEERIILYGEMESS